MKSIRHAVTALVLTLIALTAAAGAVVFSVARRVVTPDKRVPNTEILAVDTAAQTIELSRTPDTELPGRYGLFTTGTHGYVKLGAVLSADRTRVRRKLLTQIDPGARVDRPATFSGWYYSSPRELHLRWENVVVGSAHGQCPAWLFPAAPDAPASDVWVIQIHGRGGNRAECLRAVPVFHSLGMANLVVSYRNDGEGPRTRAGAYALGASEWQDVDEAISYALRHGARRVLLMGWSMGGAIALQAAVSSENRAAIIGLVLESPVIDWRSVLRFQAREQRVRDPFPDLAMSLLSSPATARWGGADHAIPFDRLDMLARADELDVPVLILHSDDDGFVPADSSYALARAREDIVTMPHFTGARHAKIWNYDQRSWTSAITDWVPSLDLSASE